MMQQAFSAGDFWYFSSLKSTYKKTLDSCCRRNDRMCVTGRCITNEIATALPRDDMPLIHTGKNILPFQHQMCVEYLSIRQRSNQNNPLPTRIRGGRNKEGGT